MNTTEQGVLQLSKLLRLLIDILLLLTFCLTNTAYAEILPADMVTHEKDSQQHHVFIIHSPDNLLHSSIIQKLTDNLNLKRPDITISKVTTEEKIKNLDSSADLIIGIGPEGMQNANEHYPKINKLFISTDPEKFKLDASTNKNDAILYMTQSYCRQIQFIKLINDNWKVISLLDSQKKPVDSNNIQQCADKYDIKTYTVNTIAGSHMTDNIKNALQHSDVLLALPDNSIYNSNSVKNILLTSYRHRKPVIAFSRNFVNAGALASIHSSPEQVAHSASHLIQQYYELDQQFENSVNYPQTFEISINRQVFRALDLAPPDVDELKQALEQPAEDTLRKP